MKKDGNDLEEKVVKVRMSNPEADMELKVKGKFAVEQSIKIMEKFDECCDIIREKDKKIPIGKNDLK